MSGGYSIFILFLFYFFMSKNNIDTVVSYLIVGTKQALKMRFKFNYEINYGLKNHEIQSFMLKC